METDKPLTPGEALRAAYRETVRTFTAPPAPPSPMTRWIREQIAALQGKTK